MTYGKQFFGIRFDVTTTDILSIRARGVSRVEPLKTTTSMDG